MTAALLSFLPMLWRSPARCSGFTLSVAKIFIVRFLLATARDWASS
jgi:hypothetical protein